MARLKLQSGDLCGMDAGDYAAVTRASRKRQPCQPYPPPHQIGRNRNVPARAVSTVVVPTTSSTTLLDVFDVIGEVEKIEHCSNARGETMASARVANASHEISAAAAAIVKLKLRCDFLLERRISILPALPRACAH